MKPSRIFFFVTIIFVMLGILMMVFPHNGIRITDKFVLKFPDIKSFFFSEKKEYADISHIIEKGSIKIDSLTVFLKNDSLGTDTFMFSIDDIKGTVHKLQFTDSSRASLNKFFEYMKTSPSKVHVIHFGDSQIEGDRISGVLRNRFQSLFMGYGIGLIPAVSVKNVSGPIIQSGSENWKRYTVFGKRDTSLKHKDYGAIGIMARYAPVWNDSISNDTVLYEAELTYKTSSVGYGNDRKFDQIILYYGNNHKPVVVELYINGEMKQFETLMSSTSVSTATFTIDIPVNEITLKFSGKDSPDIYGISFESYKGVFVDNVAMRGSSGLDFTKMNMTYQKQMFDLMNARLLICEFGVNLVPNVLEDYKFYENWFYEQLRTLKKVNPEMAIIVIGVSDMSRKVDEAYETYPNIEKIRNAQRNAAFRADCAFWDFYEAMGGKNSMPSWVMSEPSLATEDFTHLNHQGARIIGDMFTTALVWEFKEYLKKKSPEILQAGK